MLQVTRDRVRCRQPHGARDSGTHASQVGAELLHGQDPAPKNLAADRCDIDVALIRERDELLDARIVDCGISAEREDNDGLHSKQVSHAAGLFEPAVNAIDQDGVCVGAQEMHALPQLLRGDLVAVCARIRLNGPAQMNAAQYVTAGPA